MPSIIPVYSVYVDATNTYSVGFHKIKLRRDQMTSDTTWTWGVRKLAPGTVVGSLLANINQTPALASVTSDGSDTTRQTASALITAAIINGTNWELSKDPNGDVELLYVTIHSGTANT